MFDRLTSWLAALPADGWRGTVADLADALGCGSRKLAAVLDERRNDIAAAGWEMEFVLYKFRREVVFSRPVVREFVPWGGSANLHDLTPKPAKPKRKRKSSDTGVTLP